MTQTDMWSKKIVRIQPYSQESVMEINHPQRVLQQMKMINTLTSQYHKRF